MAIDLVGTEASCLTEGLTHEPITTPTLMLSTLGVGYRQGLQEYLTMHESSHRPDSLLAIIIETLELVTDYQVLLSTKLIGI